MSRLFFAFLFTPLLALSQSDTLEHEIRQRGKTSETVDWLNEAISPLKKTDNLALEKYARISLDLATSLDYKAGMGEALLLLGVSFWQRDLHQPAMEYYLDALRIFREIGDASKEAVVLTNIGNTYDELGQTDKAKTYISNALKVFERLGEASNISKGQLNLGVIYYYESKYDSALYFFDKVLEYRISVQDTSGVALTHLNLANVHEAKGDLELAVAHYRHAREFIKPTELLITNIYLGLGNGLLLTGVEKEGLNYLDSGIQSAIRTDQLYMQQIGYSYLKEYYNGKQDYQEALEYLTKEYELDKEIRGKDVQKQIEVLNLKYEDEKKARQLVLLEKEKARQESYLLITFLTCVFIAIAGVLVFFLMKLKVRNARLKEKELRDQLAHKSKELASYALNFIQKNELLNELTEKVNELKNEPAERTSKGLNQLNRMISSSMRIDQDWENFRMMFEEVHGGFFYRLKEAYPNLGNAELKLCALLRLNLNLKESSRILGISSDSVKTARSRLRKKLGLNTEDNLVDFLIRFDAKVGHKMIA